MKDPCESCMKLEKIFCNNNVNVCEEKFDYDIQGLVDED